LNIVYHHRTGATDAQRVHIMEITRALRAQGHGVYFAALVDVEAAPQSPSNAKPTGFRRLMASLKHNRFVYDFAQIAYNFYAIPMLIRTARQHNAEAIYERHALFNVAGVVAAKWLKLPIIIEVNSPLAMEQKRENAIAFVGLAAMMERWSLNRANKVLAVTEQLKKIIVAMRVQPNHILVMPNGIDPAHFGDASTDHAAKDALGLSDKIVVGFVGWFREWHGIDMLIAAAAKASADQPAIHILLIGDGPARAGLEAQIAKLGMKDKVTITGALSHDEIPHVLSCVDIAVQPAANEYCCPMKVIEYMGMGKAILAPDQPNIAELITNADNGILFKVGDVDDMAIAISELTRNPELRERLGSNAKATITSRKLLWSDNAARVVEIFETCQSRDALGTCQIQQA
jgi:glycosyltransferase involved in cell wall biosynthesis